MAEKIIDLNKPLELIPISTVNWADFPLKPDVKFSIAASKDTLYLRYEVHEKYIRAMATQINGRVWEDSCVEFFFSPRSNGRYYNFEFSCTGIPLVASGRGRSGRVALPESVIRQLTIKPSLGKGPIEPKEGDFHWTLDVEIPAAVLLFDEIASFEALDARANFYKCGDKTAEPHYLSWNPIDTPSPDFHQYKFFGKLVK
ncbi:MAG: hypothetical protein LBR06_00645 [Bacteroidales bacterium]|nr:hypothetical protein [Bacteroidales bacterium]